MLSRVRVYIFFFFNDTATTEIYTLSLHDALPIFSEGVVGSILAAVGTALPETLLPLVAIILGHGVRGEDIGIGAILGAPFMLSTLAMFILGMSVLIFARGGRRSTELGGHRRVLLQDL